MKKNLLATLLVAILASSMVFAGFSGKAEVGFAYNHATKEYGFSNGTGFDVDIDLNTQAGESKGEGNVYAGIKASMAVKLANRDNLSDAYYLFADGNYDKGTPLWDKDGSAMGIGAIFAIDEAYVAGENWKVSVTGTQGAPDFAKSMLATKNGPVKDAFGNIKDKKDVEDSYKVAAKDVAGITAEFAGYKASVGLKGKVDAGYPDFNLFVQTPEYNFNGLTLQVAAIASRDKTTMVNTYTPTWNPEKGEWSISKDPNKSDKNQFALATGASAKVGYANDTLSVSGAADFGVKFKTKETKTFGLDAVVNFAINPVSVEVYYKNTDLTKVEKDKNLISAQVVTDLTAFDVPVVLTVKGKDLVDAQDLSVEAKFPIDAFTVSAKGGYVISGADAKKLTLGAGVEYKADMFTAKADAEYSMVFDADKNSLKVNASVETDKIIPGATLALTYGNPGSDLGINSEGKPAFVDRPFNLLTGDFGKIEAKCTIKF